MLMELSWKGVYSIELDEFYSGLSFVSVGPFRGRILPGFTKIHRILWIFLNSLVNFLVG